MLRRSGLITTLVLAVVIAACGGDASTAPGALASHGESGQSFIDQLSKRGGGPGSSGNGVIQVSDRIDTVLVLKRSALLSSDVTATKVIGQRGGDIRIPSVGARIIFPPGALREDTRITMTAKGGWNVALEFAPHGIIFDVPVSVEQDLRYTLAGKIDAHDTNVQAAYYENLEESFIDRWKLFARVTEVRRVRKAEPKNPHLVQFDIIHFSGYLMSSGFKGHGGGNGGGDDDNQYPW